MSYCKLKVEEEPNPDECPACFAKLRLIFHYGLFGILAETVLVMCLSLFTVVYVPEFLNCQLI